MILEFESGEEIEVNDEDLPALLRQLREPSPIIDTNELAASIAKAIAQSMTAISGSIGFATRDALGEVLRQSIDDAITRSLATLKFPKLPNVVLPAPPLPQRLKVTDISRNRSNFIVGCDIEVVYDK